MVNPRSFSIDGITPALSALHRFSQNYQRIGPRALQRKMSGRGVQTGTWQKLRTTLSGAGWVPAGLGDVDLLIPHELLCAQPIALQTSALSVLLPTARRTDDGYAPQACGLIGDRLVPTVATLTGDTLTLTPVAGADRYQVHYWPALIVFITSLRDDMDLGNNSRGWEIVAEEI